VLTVLPPSPSSQYVLPTDTPKLSRNRVAQFMSPLLWAVNKPDRFDTWCAGEMPPGHTMICGVSVQLTLASLCVCSTAVSAPLLCAGHGLPVQARASFPVLTAADPVPAPCPCAPLPAGMVMLQLCFSSLRSDAAMRSFKRTYAECDYDLQRWRTTLRLPAVEQELLDADGGAGGPLSACCC
jgi:hypothetical protein